MKSDQEDSDNDNGKNFYSVLGTYIILIINIGFLVNVLLNLYPYIEF